LAIDDLDRQAGTLQVRAGQGQAARELPLATKATQAITRSRRKVVRDTLVLVPAALLPCKAREQRAAKRLPAGGVLIVLPAPATRQRRVCENVAAQLRATGRQVRWCGRARSTRTRCKNRQEMLPIFPAPATPH
jgi:hypothetical protein